MADRRGKRDYDALTVVLSVAAFGLAILPVVLLAGGDSAVVMALGTAYGGVVAIVAPLYARRRDHDDRDSDRGDSDA